MAGAPSGSRTRGGTHSEFAEGRGEGGRCGDPRGEVWGVPSASVPVATGCVRPPGSSPNPIRSGFGGLRRVGMVVPPCRVQASALSGERRWGWTVQATDRDLAPGDHPAPDPEPTESRPVGPKTLAQAIPRDSGHVCQESGSDTKYRDKRGSWCTRHSGTTMSSVWTGDGGQCLFFLSPRDVHGTVTRPRWDPSRAHAGCFRHPKCLRVQGTHLFLTQGAWKSTAAGLGSGARGGQGARARDSPGLSHTTGRRKEEGDRAASGSETHEPPAPPARNPADSRLRVGHTATPGWRAGRGREREA